MEGPYRDLGAGFARLTGAEGARRAPPRLHSVEDALLELVRNSRDAGAKNVFVSSTLKQRRYRTLTVLDDGEGIPDTHKHLIFEPGVTSRHLSLVPDPLAPHGAGLSLYHIKNAALVAEVLSVSSPTSIKVTFDTRTLPERSLQSGSRPSKTNLLATLRSLARHNDLNLYYAPPARILATLLYHRIIQRSRSSTDVQGRGGGLGLEVSLRTVQRILRGEIGPVESIVAEGSMPAGGGKDRRRGLGGPVLPLGEEERSAVADILRRAARASYLELEEVTLEARPGEVYVKARIYEPEEEYE